MNHWSAWADLERALLAKRFGIDVEPLARTMQWQDRAAREAARVIRRLARAFRIPRHLLVPKLATPPYKRNARKYGR